MPSAMPSFQPKRIEQEDLFTADELDNFSELLPSNVMPQLRQQDEQDERNDEAAMFNQEETGEVEGSTEQYQQTALSKMNEFFNQQIDFD